MAEISPQNLTDPEEAALLYNNVDVFFGHLQCSDFLGLYRVFQNAWRIATGFFGGIDMVFSQNTKRETSRQITN